MPDPKGVHIPAEWIVEIEVTLECVNDNQVKTGSICRVPHKIREGEAEAEGKDKAKAKSKGKGNSYRPRILAMGPFHRATTSDLQIMEAAKWRAMNKLLSLSRHKKSNRTVEKCCEAIKSIDSIIRASYGEKIDMGSEELAKTMLLDGCFLLELLLKPEEKKNDPLLDDQKKMLRVLTDLTLLENQIPFVALTILSSRLFTAHRSELIKALSPQELSVSLFGCDVGSVDFSQGVYHFLHLIHMCSPDPYQQEDKHNKDPLKLERCGRKLQALGITFRPPTPDESHLNSQGSNNNKQGTVASALTEFMDNFEFKIEFDPDKQELIIPTLHIKEATEVKWRNLIALEQLRLIGIGYKFTSYAHFFKGLVSSVHDIQLLKENNIIEVDPKAKDEDLVIMFQSITIGAEQMDGRYKEVCEGLNKAEVKNGVVGYCVFLSRMVWHYLCRSWDWLLYQSLSFLQSIIDTYLGIPGKIIAFFVGAAALALTIAQTIYAVRAGKK